MASRPSAIRVKLPEGVIVAKPMPKPGWQLATIKGKYAKAYDYYGSSLSEGVTEIDWTGGNLPDDWYDEFVFRVAADGFPGRLHDLLPGRAGVCGRCGRALDRDPGAWQERRRLRDAGARPEDHGRIRRRRLRRPAIGSP